MQQKCACFIYGNQKHYLDHLAPLASLLKIPLIVTDLEVEALAKKYYPGLILRYYPPVEMAYRMTLEFDVILSTLPKPLFDTLFYIASALERKTLIHIWCPHGNSDKGYRSPFMEALSNETYLCVYGNKMVNFLKEKGAFNQLKKLFYLGNYRLTYYKNHLEYFQKEAPFKKRGPTLLYAPTWNDSEGSSSLENAYSSLIEGVPDHWTVIVKPHPLSHLPYEPQRKNVILLKEYPLIYPLIANVDVYLGDMSSIGYDALSFRLPLFFYNPQGRDPSSDPGLYLTQCGTIVRESEDLFERIENEAQEPFVKIQQEVYDEVFTKEITIDEIVTFNF